MIKRRDGSTGDSHSLCPPGAPRAPWPPPRQPRPVPRLVAALPPRNPWGLRAAAATRSRPASRSSTPSRKWPQRRAAERCGMVSSARPDPAPTAPPFAAFRRRPAGGRAAVRAKVQLGRGGCLERGPDFTADGAHTTHSTRGEALRDGPPSIGRRGGIGGCLGQRAGAHTSLHPRLGR